MMAQKRIYRNRPCSIAADLRVLRGLLNAPQDYNGRIILCILETTVTTTTGFAMRPTTIGFIYDSLTGHNFAQLDSAGNIYRYDTDSDTERKFWTATRDRKLYDLDGKFTGHYLREPVMLSLVRCGR
jgi:hypothetical protein